MVMKEHNRHSLFKIILNRNIVVLGIVSFLNDAASEMIYPLLPIFLMGVLGAGPAALGVIEGLAESAVSFLKLYSGYISDRIRRRKGWITAGYAISNIIRPLIAFAGSWLHVLVLRLTDRVGKGIRTSPRDALIVDSISPEVRGAAYGFHRALDHAGAIIGPLLASGLLLIFNDDIKTVFLLSFIPGLLAIVVLVAGVVERPVQRIGEERFHAPALRTALSCMPSNFKRYLLVLFIFTLGNSSDAFLLLQAQRVGVPIALLPIIWVVLHVVKMLFSFPGGVISDRIGRKKVIITGWAVYVLVYAGFAVAEEAWHAWVLFGIYGIYFGLSEGVEKALVADLAPVHLRGSAFGLYHLIVGIGALPASILFGVVWEGLGAAAAFGMGACLAAVAGILLAIMVRPGAPGSGTQTGARCSN